MQEAEEESGAEVSKAKFESSAPRVNPTSSNVDVHRCCLYIPPSQTGSHTRAVSSVVEPLTASTCASVSSVAEPFTASTCASVSSVVEPFTASTCASVSSVVEPFTASTCASVSSVAEPFTASTCASVSSVVEPFTASTCASVSSVAEPFTSSTCASISSVAEPFNASTCVSVSSAEEPFTASTCASISSVAEPFNASTCASVSSAEEPFTASTCASISSVAEPFTASTCASVSSVVPPHPSLRLVCDESDLSVSQQVASTDVIRQNEQGGIELNFLSKREESIYKDDTRTTVSTPEALDPSQSINNAASHAGVHVELEGNAQRKEQPGSVETAAGITESLSHAAKEFTSLDSPDAIISTVLNTTTDIGGASNNQMVSGRGRKRKRQNCGLDRKAKKRSWTQCPLPGTSTGITIPVPGTSKDSTKGRKRKRSASSPFDKKTIKKQKLSLEKQFTISSCPDSCPCKTRGRVRRMPSIYRSFTVPEPLYKNLLKKLSLEAVNQGQGQCCDRNCSFRWSREKTYGLLDERRPKSVNLAKLRRRLRNLYRKV